MIQAANNKSNDLSQTLNISNVKKGQQSSHKNSASDNQPSDMEAEEASSQKKSGGRLSRKSSKLKQSTFKTQTQKLKSIEEEPQIGPKKSLTKRQTLSPRNSEYMEDKGPMLQTPHPYTSSGKLFNNSSYFSHSYLGEDSAY